MKIDILNETTRITKTDFCGLFIFVFGLCMCEEVWIDIFQNRRSSWRRADLCFSCLDKLFLNCFHCNVMIIVFKTLIN